MDLKLVLYGVFGFGTLVVYAIAFSKRWRSNKIHHDARSRRDLMSGFALLLAALASCLAITFVLFGESGTGLRGLFAATAFGAFFGAGVVMATVEPLERPPAPPKT